MSESELPILSPTRELVSKSMKSCRVTKRDHFISEAYFTSIEMFTKGAMAAFGGVATYQLHAVAPALLPSLNIKFPLIPTVVFATALTFLINTGDWGALVKGHRRVGAEYNILYRRFRELYLYMGQPNFDKTLAQQTWSALCQQRDGRGGGGCQPTPGRRNGIPSTFSWRGERTRSCWRTWTRTSSSFVGKDQPDPSFFFVVFFVFCPSRQETVERRTLRPGKKWKSRRWE